MVVPFPTSTSCCRGPSDNCVLGSPGGSNKTNGSRVEERPRYWIRDRELAGSNPGSDGKLVSERNPEAACAFPVPNKPYGLYGR